MPRSIVAAFVALIAAGAGVLSTAAGAQTTSTQWHARTPDGQHQGNPGAGIIVGANGTGEVPCPLSTDVAHVSMLDGKTVIVDTTINVDDINGNTWEGEIFVPDDTPPGTYTMTAECVMTGGTPDFTYEDLEFTVVAPDLSTTTTTENPAGLKPVGIPPQSGGVQELAAGAPPAVTQDTLPAATVSPATVTPIAASTPAHAVAKEPSFTG